MRRAHPLRFAVLAFAATQAIAQTAAGATAVAATPSAGWSIYHVYLATYRNGDTGNDGAIPGWRDPRYAGGDLAGLLADLDRIAALGVDALWISPMFAARSSHGYDVTDYLAIGAAVGDPAGPEASLALWRRLRDEAHRRGLAIVLDVPLNHASKAYDLRSGDPWKLRPRSTGPRQAAEKLWESWNAGYRYWDFGHAPTREFLTRVALHWLIDEGADGLRLDYVRGVPLDYWSELAAAVAARAPGKLLLGECWADDAGATANVAEIARYARDGDRPGPFSALLDFPLQATLVDVLDGRAPAKRIDEILALEEAAWGETLAARFLDNHDLARFVDRVGDRAGLLAALGLVAGLEGPLVVFYGTENALGGGPNREGFTDGGRLPMPANPDASFSAEVARRLSARRESPELAHGARATLLADDESVVFARTGERAATLVALHVGKTARTVELDLAGIAPPGAPARDLWGGGQASWEGTKLRWTLPPRSGVAMRLAGGSAP